MPPRWFRNFAARYHHPRESYYSRLLPLLEPASQEERAGIPAGPVCPICNLESQNPANRYFVPTSSPISSGSRVPRRLSLASAPYSWPPPLPFLGGGNVTWI